MCSISLFPFPNWIMANLQLLSMELLPQDILFKWNHSNPALGLHISILFLSTAKYPTVW